MTVAAASPWVLNLVGDVYTPPDHPAPHPVPAQDGKPAQPVYYYPYVAGFTELGAPQAGDQPPNPHAIVRHLAEALADEGYLVTHQIEVPEKNGEPAHTELNPAPQLLLVFHWGVLRPEKLSQMTGGDVASSSAAAPPPVLNQPQMIGLLGGRKFDDTLDMELEGGQHMLEKIEYDHYFVMVSAFDFDSYLAALQAQRRGRKPPPLVRYWDAKLSTRSDGTTMAQALPILIEHAGNLFGRETTGPESITLPSVPEGRVEVGTPAVKP